MVEDWVSEEVSPMAKKKKEVRCGLEVIGSDYHERIVENATSVLNVQMP
jgi:hypothetical protein